MRLEKIDYIAKQFIIYLENNKCWGLVDNSWTDSQNGIGISFHYWLKQFMKG